MFYPSSDYLPHHADKVELRHLVEDEWTRLSLAYHRLKDSVDAVMQGLPEQSSLTLRRACRTVSSSARRMCGRPKASKVLDARDLRQQIEALQDPELLRQLSFYEKDSLKPFIVTFLDQCRRNGVQPDSSQPDVDLSPSTSADQVLGFNLSRKDYYITDLHINKEHFSPWDVDIPPPAQAPPTLGCPNLHHHLDTPAGQVLGFNLSRKDYYVTDLHINREHFSPWDVDTPPPAQAPPTLDGPHLHRHLDALLTSYSALFGEVEKNVETLPRDRYQELRRFFQRLPHTEVHLPSSLRDVRDHLHRTPLFAPLCTALLRKVVWFLFTRDVVDLSHKLEDYEKKLAICVSLFLLCCRLECRVPPTVGVFLSEDGCDVSDPTHLLACVLDLKPYYVGSLCVDESLFITLQREGSLKGEGGREEVRWGQSAVFIVLV